MQSFTGANLFLTCINRMVVCARKENPMRPIALLLGGLLWLTATAAPVCGVECAKKSSETHDAQRTGGSCHDRHTALPRPAREGGERPAKDQPCSRHPHYGEPVTDLRVAVSSGSVDAFPLIAIRNGAELLPPVSDLAAGRRAKEFSEWPDLVAAVLSLRI